MRLADPSSAASRPHTRDYLVELQRAAEFDVLEIQARRHVASDDADLAKLAVRCLVQALTRSDEGPKREEAVQWAQSLLDDVESLPEDYLLAAIAHEVVADDSAATRHALTALRKWPGVQELREYARGLATRTGNIELREELERLGGLQQ